MNKILAIICAAGTAVVVAVVAYILLNQDHADAVGEGKPNAAAPTTKGTVPSVAATTLQKRVVADGFYNPCGVAVQPETGHVFVSMVPRIVRVIPGSPAEIHDEVIGFSIDNYGRGPQYELGPLGLAFADKNTLVVGDGSQEDGEEIVRVYSAGLQPLAKNQVRKADDMISRSTPIPPGEDSIKGEGNFYGVAIYGSTVFVTSNGDDSKGWICKLNLDLKKTAPLPLVPFIKSKELTDTNAPMGATISPDGKLVVSQFGSTSSYPDSLLTIYDPATGRLEKQLPTGLRDLIGIAYSPKTGKLYGLDFSWAEPKKGGLFLLEIGAAQVQAVKFADLEKPTALAFSPAGQLYVTVIGSPQGKTSGQLLVFEGL